MSAARAWSLVAACLLVWAVSGCTSDAGRDSGGPDTTLEIRDSGDDAPLTMVAINQLHGLSCPDETDWCDAPARLELLWRELREAGCPDLVGLTEIGERQQELVPALLPELCDGRYELVWDPEAQGQPFDQQMILTALPVVDQAYVELAAFPWGAQWVRVESSLGLVDFTTTHFASTANNPPCDPGICPPACETGVEVGTCHAVQLSSFLDDRPGAVMQVISGDLNKPVDDPRLVPIAEAGFADVFALAGVAECDPATGQGCTCCIGSEAEPWDGGGLRDATAARDGRIDFILVRGSAGCTVETVGDATTVFAGQPAAVPVRGVLWPSDHAGVVTAVGCA